MVIPNIHKSNQVRGRETNNRIAVDREPAKKNALHRKFDQMVARVSVRVFRGYERLRHR